MTFPDAGLFLSRFIVRETCANQDKIVGKSGLFYQIPNYCTFFATEEQIDQTQSQILMLFNYQVSLYEIIVTTLCVHLPGLPSRE